LSTLYDGINTDAATIAKIIKPGDKVAYYNDGRYAWTPEEIALFPHNEHITITVLGGVADACDCETGDMTPAQAAAWVRKRKLAGYLRPTVYRSLALMADIRQATGNLVMGKDWDAWVADYDNSPSNVYEGAALKQYRSTSGYDVSEIYDENWPHRSAVVVPPVKPVAPVVLPKWPAGLTLVLGNKGNAVEALQKALSNSGIPGVRGISEDGVFGQQTRTAVRNFEVDQNLELDADGLALAGPQVRAQLIHLGLLNSAGQPTH
jgi:hypothetical protein